MVRPHEEEERGSIFLDFLWTAPNMFFNDTVSSALSKLICYIKVKLWLSIMLWFQIRRDIMLWL